MKCNIVGCVKFNNKLKGSCFLVSNKYIFTAAHVIDNILEEKLDMPIICEFVEVKLSVKVSIEYTESNLDIAVLKVLDEIHMELEYYSFSRVPIEKGNFWEAEGYPIINLGEKAYIEGKVRRIKEEKPILKYELTIFDQKPETDWEGMSGAPLIIDDEIAGIILEEEEDNIKSRLIVVAVEEVVEDISANKECVLDSINVGMHALLKDRMTGFEETCKEIFYSSFEEIDSHDVNYFILKKQPKSIDMLVQRLKYCIRSYGVDLATIENSHKGNFMSRAEIDYCIDEKMKQVIEWIKSAKQIVYILLWIFIEGIKKYPRIGGKVNKTCEGNITDVYIKDSNEINVLIGMGDMQKDFQDTVRSCLNAINNYIKDGKIDVSDEVFIWDELILSSLKYTTQNKLKYFPINETGLKVNVALILAWESSDVFRANEPNEKGDQILKMSYLKREIENKKNDVQDIAKAYSWISKIEFTCFIVPFNNIEEFENKIIECI